MLEAEQQLIFERTWQLAGHVSALLAPRQLCDRRGRHAAGAGRARRAGAAAGLPQRLPAPRLAAAERRRPVQGGDPLPLSRLDVSLRRHPDRRPRGARVRRAPRQAARSGCCRSEWRSSAAWCSSTSTRTRRRWPSWSATCPSGSSATGSRSLAPFAPAGGTQPANWKVIADNYIEGYHIPIAHPGLMRMLDYKRYDVEVHQHYVWFESPLRSKPSSNRLERMYAGLVRPMPGLSRARPARLALRVHLSRTRRSTCTPTRSTPGRWCPTEWPAPATSSACFRPPGADPRTRLVQWLNQRLNNLVLDEDIDLVDNVQQGLQTRGYECGPLSRREDAVAWFADRIRADLRTPRRRRLPRARPRRERAGPPQCARADPRRGSAADRQRGHRRRPDRADRDGRRRLHLARPLPLRQPRRAAGAGARLLLRPRRRRPDLQRRAAGQLPCAAPAVDDRPVPAELTRARATTGCCGSSCGCGRCAIRTCARSPRSSTAGCTPGLPRRSRPASPRSEFSALRRRTRSPTGRSR